MNTLDSAQNNWADVTKNIDEVQKCWVCNDFDQSNINVELVSRKHLFLIISVENSSFDIFVETVSFKILWWIESKKKTHLFER